MENGVHAFVRYTVQIDANRRVRIGFGKSQLPHRHISLNRGVSRVGPIKSLQQQEVADDVTWKPY